MLVSIQGIKGSYHHDVACALYGDDVNILECLSFDKMAESVFESKAQIGIMAIENSIAGSIIPNYAIIDKLNLKIVGEYYINIGLTTPLVTMLICHGLFLSWDNDLVVKKIIEKTKNIFTKLFMLVVFKSILPQT